MSSEIELKCSNRGGKRQGQTLIIALILMGVLLVIGFVFLGIVNRNIVSTGRQQQRHVLDYLTNACAAHDIGLPVQSLLPQAA